jgi:hypothetical protein
MSGGAAAMGLGPLAGQPLGRTRQSPSSWRRRKVPRIAASSAWSSMPARTDARQIVCAWLYRVRSARQSVTWSNRSTAGGSDGRGWAAPARGSAATVGTSTAAVSVFLAVKAYSDQDPDRDDQRAARAAGSAPGPAAEHLLQRRTVGGEGLLVGGEGEEQDPAVP